MTAKERRALVISQAKPAIGRNLYSQDAAKRECVFAPYKDGKYYSDCSSFVRGMYRKACIGLNNIGGNTEGIILNKNGIEIDCKIKSGVPTDASALRVGDVFLFRGTNRARTRYVGHVEIVESIKGNSVTLMGHGSGHPKTHSMTAYCRFRQLWKVPGVIRNRGLICVKRFIQDDVIAPADPTQEVQVIGSNVHVRTGPGISNKSIGIVSKGYKLHLSGESAPGWTGVMYEGHKAYIFSLYVKVVDPG